MTISFQSFSSSSDTTSHHCSSSTSSSSGSNPSVIPNIHQYQKHFGMPSFFRKQSTQHNLSEKDRLNALHALHKTVLEPYHSDIINAHLYNIHLTNRRTAVLDVGTGTGAWAIEIANTHQYSDVLAVDIDWRLMTHNTPSRYGNLDFAAVDVEEPLPWPRGSFDVIHVKGLLLEIPNYSKLIEKLAMVLRPGGLLVIAEAEPMIIAADHQELPRCLKQWNACVETAFSALGIDVNFPSKIMSSIANSGVFATSPYFQQLAVPTGSNIRSSHIHPELTSANMKKTFDILLEHGYVKEDIENLFNMCLTELSNPNQKYVQRLFAVYATKTY